MYISCHWISFFPKQHSEEGRVLAGGEAPDKIIYMCVDISIFYKSDLSINIYITLSGYHNSNAASEIEN